MFRYKGNHRQHGNHLKGNSDTELQKKKKEKISSSEEQRVISQSKSNTLRNFSGS